MASAEICNWNVHTSFSVYSLLFLIFFSHSTGTLIIAVCDFRYENSQIAKNSFDMSPISRLENHWKDCVVLLNLKQDQQDILEPDESHN